MDMRKFLKLNIVVPVLTGLAVGSIFFVWGEIDDAPGLCLTAILLCTGLLYVGTRNAGKINKTVKPAIVLPVLFGSVGIVWISAYLIRGVYDEPPGLILAGMTVSVALISAGLIHLKRVNKARREKRPVGPDVSSTDCQEI
ncbi:MAG: hypothetical protein LBD27_03540 [Tannerella sp.]|nr:hypothetical protein [Tannerella sp.]